MKNTRIFVTGGTGFFGKSLLRHCAELKQSEIVLLSHESDEFITEFPWVLADKRIKILRGDVRNFEFPKGNFDYIYHGATTSSRIIPDSEMTSVVIDGTKRVLDFARKNRQLSKLLYISSGAVYGTKYNTPIKEDFSCDPVDAYGRSKLKAENLCFESGVRCCIARCFAFVGEYLPLNAHFAIGNFIGDCLNDKPVIIKGDGTTIRSYLYAGDLTHWLWTILIHGKHGYVYNVGSDRITSIKELAETVRKVAGTNNEIRILQKPSGAPAGCYVPDISRVRSELGLEITTPLEEAIRRTIKHHQEASHSLIKVDSKEKRRNGLF